jgi:Cof subfamily protein (haloacid dehalogenase superfamily)
LLGKPIRLIATDLDGTLLDSDHRVTPLTERAIRNALARGVLFTVATGKTFPSTLSLIRQFDIKIPVICGNGTLIHRPDGSILHEDPIPRDLAIEAIRMARAARLTPIVYAGLGLLTPVRNRNIDVLTAHHEPDPEIVPDLEAALESRYQPHKLILMEEDNLEAVAAFQIELERVFAGRAQVLRSGLASVIELLPLGVTKGTALTFILDYLGIPSEQVIAFGDNCNDLDMIQRAGIGIAMGHSPEAVRQGADDVTGTNNEDGVGYAIQKWV